MATTRLLSAMVATWNNVATTFTGLKLNVTDTASAAGSLLMDLQVGGVSKFNVGKDGTVVSPLAFVSGGNVRILNNAGYYALGTSNDVVLARDAANTLALRNGTAAQAFNVYNTYTDASNYEAAGIGFNGGVLYMGTTKIGTGTSIPVQFRMGGSNIFQIATNGNLIWNTDNTYDIGASGTSRPRDFFLGRNANVGGTLTAGTSIYLSTSSKAQLLSPLDAVVRMANAAGTITTDITLSGASGVGGSTATFGGPLVSLNELRAGNNIQVNAAGILYWASRSFMQSPSNGIVQLSNFGATDFTRLILGTNDASGVSLKKSGTQLQVRLGDDTGDAGLAVGTLTAGSSITSYTNIVAGATGTLGFTSRGGIKAASDGVLGIYNAAGTDVSLFQFGGTTSSFPALKRSATTIQVRLADDSGYASFNAQTITAAGNVIADTGYVRTETKTVATLTAAATAGASARSFVTDALGPTFGAAVVGGGAVKVPVYSDGVAWLVG